jgi:hypothetical protein
MSIIIGLIEDNEVIQMMVIVAAVIGILFGMIAIVLAMLQMNTNQVELKKTPFKKEVVTLLHTHSERIESIDLDNQNQYEYFADFEFENGMTKTFNVEKDMFIYLFSGSTGEIVFKGNDLVSFDVYQDNLAHDSDSHAFFFEHFPKIGKTVEFYCLSPIHKIEIKDSESISCDFRDIVTFIDQMETNRKENYFGIEDDHVCIQFFNDGRSSSYEIDMPMIYKGGSYQGMTHSSEEVKRIVNEFFEGVNISEKYNLQFITFR